MAAAGALAGRAGPVQALIPAAAAATFWIPLDGRQYLAKPACGLLLAATAAAWLGLAARA